MIHLCIVWRNGKKTITSSDTVTMDERLKASLNKAKKEAWKTIKTLQDNDTSLFLGDTEHKLEYVNYGKGDKP